MAVAYDNTSAKHDLSGGKRVDARRPRMVSDSRPNIIHCFFNIANFGLLLAVGTHVAIALTNSPAIHPAYLAQTHGVCNTTQQQSRHDIDGIEKLG
jgi:hypothetical protein